MHNRKQYCHIGLFFGINILFFQSNDWGASPPSLLERMEPKDYVAIVAVVISSFSFIISAITLRQKKYETERTIRNQLTDVVADLNTVFADWDKLNYESAMNRNEPYIVNRRAFLNGQKRFLARQATYLMNQVPHLVSDYEYATVAGAFQGIGDFEQANIYWEKAVEASPDAYYRVMNLRGYARALFSQAHFDQGRDKFRESVALLTLTNDRNKWTIAETYQAWASIEADWDSSDEAAGLIEDAEEIYNQIQNKRQRREGLSNLNEVRRSIFPDTGIEKPDGDKLA